VSRLLLAAVLAAGLVVGVGSPDARPRAAAIPDFGHVVVIVFENKDEGDVFRSSRAPAFNALARRYAGFSRYVGVTHPSLPNYLALVSGSTQGITSNCTSCLVPGRSLADTIEASGRTWKTYAEGLPRPGFTGCCAGRYAKKHNPFLYFRRVVARPDRLRRVVPLAQLSRDLRAGSLPDLSLVVPDLCHDMHDCSVATGDRWLKGFVPPLLRDDTVVFVVFDESAGGSPAHARIPALALGPLVRRGSTFTRTVSHYGLLRTIEDAWGLPRLGRSAAATPITGIWRLPQ
jgi:hypothetical protein